MHTKTDKISKLAMQLFKFAMVGGIAACVDVGLLLILKEVLHMDVLLSSAISFSVSVTVNYLLSMTFVFASKNQSKIKEFVIFVCLSIGGLCLNQLVLWIGVQYTSVHYLAVKIFAMILVPIYNFVTRKIVLESKEKGGNSHE
ncbi:MAG: GtrA family protein [Clostridia bacterium]|nr:GtrA family protein [Clostridia bacterium]